MKTLLSVWPVCRGRGCSVFRIDAARSQQAPAAASTCTGSPGSCRRRQGAGGRTESVCAAAAPPLPPGMTGSDTNDPRYTLKPGLYDAGEAALGMKHVAFVKKPDAFQITATSPDDPEVQKTLGQLGVGDPSKMPKPMKLVIAQLAFANSDFAFQGNHLFQGNFYGINIYDIANPAKPALLDLAGVPGRAGRCFGVREPALHVGGDAQWTPGLRRAGLSAGASAAAASRGQEKRTAHPGSAERPLPRRKNLRYFGHQEPEASSSGADLPRLAHPYAGGGSER